MVDHQASKVVRRHRYPLARVVPTNNSRILVYLGAINTTLILLLGPFAQQSVSLPLRPVNSTAESGSIPITTQYQVYVSAQTMRESLKTPAPIL